MGIPEKLVAFLFGFLMVFGAGWAYRGYADEHKEVKALQIEQHETSKAIEKSVIDSVKVDDDIQIDHTRIDAIKSAVAIRLSTPTYRVQNDPDQRLRPDPAAPASLAVQPDRILASVLDAGTVRMLNAARVGAELRTAGGRNDQEPAATDPAR